VWFACDVLFLGFVPFFSDLMHWCSLLALNAFACCKICSILQTYTQQQKAFAATKLEAQQGITEDAC
jgi:hypothetical protein